MDRTLTYREALRAFADGKTLEFFDGNGWHQPSFITSGPSDCDLDTPSPYRIRQATITINGVEVPEPLREAPRDDVLYWYAHLSFPDDAPSSQWDGDKTDAARLRLGIVHLTKEAAEAHARALILASGGQV